MKYISFLRGINVGGKRPLPMKELIKMLSDFGMQEITTYIQSGNVIYNCEINDQLVISKQIEDGIKDAYGYNVPVITLSVKEFLQKIELNPYLSDTESNRLHVSFLERIPTQNNINTLYKVNVEPESFSIIKNIIIIK